MVSITKYQQWYCCFRKMSSKRFISTLFSASSKSNYSNHSTQIRHMSIIDNSKNMNETDVKKLLEDGTVPEESPVIGDTENWTTSPYPKGLNCIFKTVFVLIYSLFTTRFICTPQKPVSSAARSTTKSGPQGNVNTDVSRPRYPVCGHGKKSVSVSSSCRDVQCGK